ncbi:MAG: hypothetical protein GY809_02370 [Planctomycetes bacterium]|nr:hypothetical protein [Planctomycetota bacterium]
MVEGSFEHLVSDRAVFHNVYAEIPGNRYNKQGRFFLSTVERKTGPSNDQMTGVVESPVFALEGPTLSFLIGGGRADTVYVALCTLDGKEVLKSRGRQTRIMHRVTWSARQWVGQSVFLRIVDASTQGWGHVTFDDFTAQGRIDPRATATRFSQRKPMLYLAGVTVTSTEGTFYVQDVYQGTHMQGVERGTVKSLRVVEAPEKRTWAAGKWFGLLCRARREVCLFPGPQRPGYDDPLHAKRRHGAAR